MANYASNIFGGMGSGAVAGASTGNPYVALAGGAVGALGGLLKSFTEADNERQKRRILEDIKDKFNLTQNEVDGLIAEYYADPNNFLGTQEDVAAYREAVKSYSPDKFVYDFDEFVYDKDVDDFLNPYYDKIIKDTSDKVQRTAAGAGVGRGTGAANAIATAVAQKDDELYKTALQEYNTDRAQKYNEWSGNINLMQQKLNQLKAATDTGLQLGGNLAQNYLDTRQQYFNDLVASKQNRSNGNLQLASAGLMI